MGSSLSRRRRLRRQAIDAEATLWALLRGRRLGGFRFHRQHVLGPFTVDFFCPERRLAVEIDRGHDQRRDEVLAARGISVVRLSRERVLRRTAAVLTTIAFALNDGTSPRIRRDKQRGTKDQRDQEFG
jgi:very-short-patch-repair endonuclease